jgi:hypothetical protein
MLLSQFGPRRRTMLLVVKMPCGFSDKLEAELEVIAISGKI